MESLGTWRVWGQAVATDTTFGEHTWCSADTMIVGQPTIALHQILDMFGAEFAVFLTHTGGEIIPPHKPDIPVGSHDNALSPTIPGQGSRKDDYLTEPFVGGAAHVAHVVLGKNEDVLTHETKTLFIFVLHDTRKDRDLVGPDVFEQYVRLCHIILVLIR